MPRGLLRYHESGQSHFITFSCYRRKPKFADTRFYDLFPLCLEAMRLRFRMRIYGYVVMPEHVHLLVSEPEHGNLAEAMHYLKLSFSKRAKSLTGAQVSVQTKDAHLGHTNNHHQQQQPRVRTVLAKEILRPKRTKRARVRRQVALSASESREARIGE